LAKFVLLAAALCVARPSGSVARALCLGHLACSPFVYRLITSPGRSVIFNLNGEYTIAGVTVFFSLLYFLFGFIAPPKAQLTESRAKKNM